MKLSGDRCIKWRFDCAAMNRVLHTISFWAVNYSEVFHGRNLSKIHYGVGQHGSNYILLIWSVVKKASVKTVTLLPSEIGMFQNN